MRKAVHRLSEVEGRIGEMEASQVPGDAGQLEKRTRSSGERPYLNVVTPDPMPDDVIVLGEAAEMEDEWRGLRTAHPATRYRPPRVEERMLELEIALIDEFKLTLPPETYPWDGLSRADQVHWRRRALREVHRRRAWQDIKDFVRRVLTLRIWRK